MKTLLLTLVVLLFVTATRVQAASLEKTIANINADAKGAGGPELALKSISASTHVSVATLEKEKNQTGLSYGDLFAAHFLAKASGKSFDEIAALKASGQTWDKVADDNNLSLDRKKTIKQAVVVKATPTPTPQKSLAEEQRERWKH